MQFIKKIGSWIIPIIVGIVTVLLLRQYVVQPVSVSGPSMYPNLENGEKVFCFKPLPIKRGSVIVFDALGVDPSVTQTKMYVKRVIGMPGDKVEFKDNAIYVNDKKINQSYISDQQQSAGTDSKTIKSNNWTLMSLYNAAQKLNLVSVSNADGWSKRPVGNWVPKNTYFVLGDNREVSNDSRTIGFVPKDNIQGVVKVPFWAKNRERINYINNQWKLEEN